MKVLASEKMGVFASLSLLFSQLYKITIIPILKKLGLQGFIFLTQETKLESEIPTQIRVVGPQIPSLAIS